MCKPYLVGFCPDSVLGKKIETLHETLSLQPCTKLHSVALKEEFLKHPEVDRYRKEYEEGFLKRLEEITAEADSRAMREKRRRRPKETVTRIPEHLKVKVQAYEQDRREALKEAEELGSKGDVEGSQEAMEEAERARKNIDGIEKFHTREFPGEEVCEACGVRYLMGRMDDVKGYDHYREGDVWEEYHFKGKLHKGYLEIREALRELREKIRKRRDGRTRERIETKGNDNGPQETSRGYTDRDADRGRRRSRDRGRGERDGGDRSRSRERGDRHNRRRSRSRGRDRNRDDRARRH